MIAFKKVNKKRKAKTQKDLGKKPLALETFENKSPKGTNIWAKQFCLW